VKIIGAFVLRCCEEDIMIYRLKARIKGYFRRRRYYSLKGVQYHEYGPGVTEWQGWYEDDKGCLAFKSHDGELFFDW
jgi:hypothetical protein